MMLANDGKCNERENLILMYKNFSSHSLSMRIKSSWYGLLVTGKRAVSSGHGLYWVDRTDCGGPKGGASHRSCRGKHLEEKVAQHQQNGGDTRH